ncbi:N-6 DNA methylase [Halorussus salilacus]|uniref:Eco57I restriction-modification methylase domain-containing protein n=1 Tax=Halorussus salilacus TaxID=2953750 RepID=UPI0020A19751|nr:TaqI-like C-terminal specificity domain-containing protein [Halorussus salilacus]USZ69158.1 N-6 DNA methylase [Halorussus salilacus]
MSQPTLSSEPYRNSNLFSGYYLDERIAELDEWEDAEGVEGAFERLQALYEREQKVVEGQKEDALIDAWIDPVLEILGYGSRPEVTLPDGGGYIDRLLFDSEEARREAEMEAMEADEEVLFKKASGLLEAKQWNASFTQRFSEERQYRDASHQVKFYLERTPESVQWGILTNGRKWRLYGTNDYETQTFYEIDLPELLEFGDVEDFKYFYLFFRPEAFREVSGSTFLDTVWNESETAAQELGEDLQDNVFTALRVLGKGFVETNDLHIDPDDEAALDELKEQSLVLLYRLMFVLYAESRNLIDPDDSTAKQKYDENFSLDRKRLDILDTIDSGESFDSAYSEYSMSIWQRLQDLFRLIDQGEDDLGIPPYNGGLFDADEHEFLAENRVADEYIAEVIYRLSTTETDEGEFVPADYADLDTRHLGSIYEGLLEHEFRIAPEQYAAVSEDGGQVWKPATEVSVADAVETVPEGSLYVVNDEGERKATGAYYTPDYVVTYIVEETVDPLIEEIDEDLAETDLEPGTVEYVTEFWKRVKELKILDPAMGSGHFLTKATGYLAEQVMAEVRELETATLFDEEQIRREVSKECIYGVDLNGMAVELAKLSMWLETLSADQPLAFLDHHLKAGNSLVGSDITEILSTSDEDGPSGQAKLQDFLEQTRQQALQQVMDRMQDLLAIENDTLADIKEMERTYEEIREDPLFERLLEMASVHTAGQFGLDVPDNADERMAKALRDDSWADVAETDWFRSAQAMAGEEQFFHWELEFPEVFFGEDGGVSEDAGFDAVVGNPPYVRIYGDTLNDDFVEFLRTTYETAHMKFDLYVIFTQKGIELTRENGTFSYIIPDKFANAPYGEPIREFILRQTSIQSILDLREKSVFKGVTVSNLIPVLRNSNSSEKSFELRLWKDDTHQVAGSLTRETTVSRDDSSFRLSRTAKDVELSQKIKNQSLRFDRIFYVNWGLRTGTKEKTEKYVVKDSDAPNSYPMIRGQNIVGRYRLNPPSERIIYEKSDLYNPMFAELFESDKIVFRKISGRGLMAVADKTGYYCFSTLIPCVNIQDVQDVNRPGIPEATPESSKYTNIYYPLTLVNSSLMQWFYKTNLSDNLSVVPNHINKLPIAEIEGPAKSHKKESENGLTEKAIRAINGSQSIENVVDSASEILSEDRDTEVYRLLSNIGEEIMELNQSHLQLNLQLQDYLGNYSDGQTITEIGFTQPPAGSANSILNETTETRTKLQIERAKVEREGPTSVTVHLTARYKPDEEDGHDLDQYGYTETEFLPALRITDLTETEADLVEAFVPVAVEEAGGFADFRDNATKTNSLMDRLKKLTLPKVEDVESGLKSYIETKARAEELDAKIERTDDLIDQIVYELYGLTDEEIEIVENAVGE